MFAASIAIGACGQSGPDAARDRCTQGFDSKTWKKVLREEDWGAKSSEDDRRRLAADVVRCRFAANLSKKEVLRLLGPPPDGETIEESDGSYSWLYTLGPDEIGIDSDTLYVNFSRSDRVESVEIIGG